MMQPHLIGFALLTLLLPATPLSAQSLGTIDFPTSGSPDAHAAFIRGVLFMHSFEYEDAAKAFQAAEAAQPDFAMAYWGEAMSYNHPVWQQQDSVAARITLARLGATPEERAAKAGTDRERAYLAAVEILYAEGEDKWTRDLAYRDAMRRLHEAYPDDDEAAALYALALLGSAHEGRDSATYMRAAAVAQPILERNRDHPGAVHYTIHSFDDPIHAPLGLPAARAYSEVAPAAGHAQHMTSHIFVAMGLWDDVVAANERAVGVQTARLQGLGRRANVCGHYTYWLEYGYLQQGRHEKAAEVLQRCYERQGDQPTAGEVGSFVLMRARYVLDTEDWASADRWAVKGLTTAEYVFTDGIAELMAGDGSGAGAVVAELGRIADNETGAAQAERARILSLQLTALAEVADGRIDSAVGLLEEAVRREAAMPFEFGPPHVVKPSHELLGEVLLEAGEASEARVAFAKSLDRTPERTSSLLGMARAARASADGALVSELVRRLEGIWHDADAALLEAKGIHKLTSWEKR